VSGGGTTSIGCPIELDAASSFDVSSATTLALGGGLSSAGFSIAKIGSGTMILQAPSSASGLPVVINDGELMVTSGSALGTAPQIIVNNGGVFHIDAPGGSDVNF